MWGGAPGYTHTNTSNAFHVTFEVRGWNHRGLKSDWPPAWSRGDRNVGDGVAGAAGGLLERCARVLREQDRELMSGAREVGTRLPAVFT